MSCWCYECLNNEIIQLGPVTITTAMTRMILCPDCGNKRCPKATDHLLECTGSNEPGQLGSKHGVYPHPNIELLRFIEKGSKK